MLSAVTTNTKNEDQHTKVVVFQKSGLRFSNLNLDGEASWEG